MVIAIVHAAGEICHVAAAASVDAVRRQLAPFLRAEAAVQLEPCDAVRVLDLLGSGCYREAIKLYFARMGRWENQRLSVRRVRGHSP